MSNRLRQPVNWIGYIGLILTMLGAVIAATGQVQEVRDDVRHTARRIEAIEADRRETLADYREWRSGVDQDRATVKAQFAEILRRLERLDR